MAILIDMILMIHHSKICYDIDWGKYRFRGHDYYPTFALLNL